MPSGREDRGVAGIGLAGEHGLREKGSTQGQAVQAAHQRGLPVCTHLIVGLPGEGGESSMASLEQVLALGVEGLKLHPLHVVKGTRLANQWRAGDYSPLTDQAYLETGNNGNRRKRAIAILRRLARNSLPPRFGRQLLPWPCSAARARRRMVC